MESVNWDVDAYLIEKYKEWCLANPNLVFCDENENSGNRGTAEECLDSFFKSDANKWFVDCVPRETTVPSKSNEIAKQFKDLGNKKYRGKEDHEALKLYTQALLYCEGHGELSATLFANRSAVLLSFGDRFSLGSAIRDITRAIKGGFPKGSVYKLYDRLGKCHYKLGRPSEAKTSFEKALELLKDSPLDDAKRESFRKDANKFINAIKSKGLGQESKDVLADVERETDPLKPPKLTCSNSQFKYLSAAVKVENSKQKGRHVVAKRNISVGEIVGVEECIVTYLFPDKRGFQICTNCLAFAQDSIPSPISTKDVFCSDGCIKKAMETFHPVETTISGLVDSTERKDWLLGLRAVVQKPLKFFTESKIFEEHDTNYGTNLFEEEVYEGAYKSLFNLVKFDEKVEMAKLQFRSFGAFFFTHCLAMGGYFKDDDTQANRMLIARLITHFMGVASMNCHEVGQFVAPHKEALHKGELKSIGTSLEPTLDLFNHSCHPTVIRHNVGNHVTAVSCREIKEGDEITDNYYSMYFEVEKTKRRENLKKYHFDCDCEACSKGWAVASEIPKALVDIPDFQLKFSTDDPKAMQAIFTKINQIGTKIAVEQKQENYATVRALCIEFLKVLEKNIEPPHNFYVMALKALSKTNWILHSRIAIDTSNKTESL